MADDNSSSTQSPGSQAYDDLVRITAELERIEGSHFLDLEERTRWQMSDACANAGGILEKFLGGTVNSETIKPRMIELSETDETLHDDLSNYLGEAAGIADLFMAATHGDPSCELERESILFVAQAQYYKARALKKRLDGDAS